MERYTDLEQALRDPSLAFITEDITTLTELNKAIIRYKGLLKKQRRFSNYYSTEFLGRNVPEMYVLVRDRLFTENNPFEDVQLPTDKYLVSEPDLYYREESFNAGDINICFLLGHSGSGKSARAQSIISVSRRGTASPRKSMKTKSLWISSGSQWTMRKSIKTGNTS